MYGVGAEPRRFGLVWCVIQYVEMSEEGRRMVVAFVHVHDLAQRPVAIQPLSRIIPIRTFLLGRYARDIAVHGDIESVAWGRGIEGGPNVVGCELQ